MRLNANQLGSGCWSGRRWGIRAAIRCHGRTLHPRSRRTTISGTTISGAAISGAAISGAAIAAATISAAAGGAAGPAAAITAVIYRGSALIIGRAAATATVMVPSAAAMTRQRRLFGRHQAQPNERHQRARQRHKSFAHFILQKFFEKWTVKQKSLRAAQGTQAILAAVKNKRGHQPSWPRWNDNDAAIKVKPIGKVGAVCRNAHFSDNSWPVARWVSFDHEFT
jgi:hypothetical protein